MTHPPLVGRRAELATFTSALEAARRGSGGMHVITGEGGVGKTRLTSEVIGLAAGRSFTSVTGRAFPVERGIPYALFADAFVPMLRDLGPATLDALTRGGRGDLALLFPALGEPRERALDAGDASGLKPRLLDSFARVVQGLAKKSPLLVVLENLQWADPSSFDLLHFLGRNAAAHPLLFLCTYNEEQRDASPILRATEQSLVSLGVLRRHQLPPLTREETTELLERQFGVAGNAIAPFVALLHARTRGNAFFIEETVKALVASGRLRRDGNAWVGWDVDHLELPASIRDALHARFMGLSDTAQDVAIAAAVVGSSTPHALLESLGHLRGERLLPAIEELLRERVLVETTAWGALAYEFSHPLLQETLYAGIARARARQLHGEVAEALEALFGARALERADALAVHFLMAEAPAHAPRACRYLAAAGRSALDRGADREAARSLEAAYGIAERRDDAATREELLDLLARARRRTGDYAGAATLWSEALLRANADGEVARVSALERRLGDASFRRGEADDALRHHERALAAAARTGDASLSASAHVARSRALLDLGRGDEAEEDLRAALSLAEARQDPALLTRVWQARQMLALWRGPSTDARAHGERALEIAARAGDRASAWSAHWALAMHAAFTGNAEGTKTHLADARAVADELRAPVRRLWTTEVEVEYLSSVGEWEAALPIGERAIAEARAFGQRQLLPRLLVWTALMRLARGEEEPARAMLDEAWHLSGAARANEGVALNLHTVIPAHVGQVFWHLQRREYHEALHVGEAGLALADRTGYTAWAMHRLMPAVAEASLWVKDWERAARYGARLRETATRLAHPLGLAWSEACFALIRMLKGDKAGAVAQLRQAADQLDAIPFAEHAARLRRKLADAYCDSGAPKAAEPELRRCHAMFAKLGARPALDEVRDKMRALGMRPPPLPKGAGVADTALTPTEVKVAVLVAAGRSNKEIGAALGITGRTAGTHLSNIYAKLGIDNRVQLAEQVRARNLA